MSSILRKKSKNVREYGYSKSELAAIKDKSDRNAMRSDIALNSYHNTKIVSYQILHDKFGFGHKRIIRLENTINSYLEEYADGTLNTASLGEYLYQKHKLNVVEEVNKIPFREKVLFIKDKFPSKPEIAKQTGRIVGAAIYNYLVLACTALKTQFNFSIRQLESFIDYVKDYINTLSRFEQFQLSVLDIENCLEEECRYVSERIKGYGKEMRTL